MWIETLENRWIRSEDILEVFNEHDCLTIVAFVDHKPYSIIEHPTDDAISKFLNLISSSSQMIIHQSDLAPIRRNRETQNQGSPVTVQPLTAEEITAIPDEIRVEIESAVYKATKIIEVLESRTNSGIAAFAVRMLSSRWSTK